MMAAYLIADVQVHDPETFSQYSPGVAATLEPYGGRFLARGGAAEIVEGDYEPHRVVVIEFPDMDALKSWHDSDAYQAIIGIRHRSATTSVIAVQGV